METAADKYCFARDKENNERSKQHAMVTVAIDTVVMETKRDEEKRWQDLTNMLPVGEKIVAMDTGHRNGGHEH